MALFVALSVGIARPAAANQRMAVLIWADGDPELGDNLNELVISTLAKTSKRELVGLREIRKRLHESERFARGGLAACVEDRPCLAWVGDVAGANSAVVGLVRRSDEKFSIELALVDLKTGVRQVEVSETSALEIAQLITTLQSGIVSLFGADSKSTKPSSVELPPQASKAETRSLPILPALTPAPRAAPRREPGGANLRAPTDRSSQASQPTKTVIAYAIAAAAVVAFSTAGVTGSIAASGTPHGATRAEAQADLERRQDFASATNGFLIGGAALTVFAGATYLWP
jgi:hypothetical protein